MTKLVENGVGDTGQGQIMDRGSHMKEFSSRFKSGGEVVEDFKYWQGGWGGGHMVGCTF